MEKSSLNTLHKPLGLFFYGSMAVIVLALTVGSFYLSNEFIKNEKKRASISNVQVSQSLSSEHRYIVEEFFTGSYESILLRVTNALQKFGSPNFELYLFDEMGSCFIAKNSNGKELACKKFVEADKDHLLYSSDLKLGTKKLGDMRVLVQDPFQFFKGSMISFAFSHFLPIFGFVIALWGIWALFSKKHILLPYYRQMVALEKQKVSTDIIRQIIHDTKGEIAALDLLTYELGEQDKAEEMRKTLHNIREAFGNLSHHKEGIVTSVREVPTNARSLVQDFVEQQKIKYKRYSSPITIKSSLRGDLSHKVKVDANTFYRVLSNLVENSATAPCSLNERIIHISLEETLSSVLVTVADNCDGLGDDVIGRLFEKGFTTKNTGSGQGLHYVRTVVEGWGGKISFTTKTLDGRGTSFTLELPSYAKPKVVILDDNVSLLYRYKKMIERYGHEAEVFTDSSSLSSRARFFDKDTIFLLDFNLSDSTNGAEVARGLSSLGLSQIFLHTGNPSLKKEDYPFITEILSKGNFLETIGRLGIIA
jgi:CheY-like chemotaxis protein